MVDFTIYFPIAKSVVLDIWKDRTNLSCITMQVDQEGFWKAELDLAEGVYYYCFLINNCFRIVDPDSSPIIGTTTGKIASCIEVADAGVIKLKPDSSCVEIVGINMYSGSDKVFNFEREFLNTSGEIGACVEINKVKALHIFTFLWINPNIDIIYHSESIICDDYKMKKESIFIWGWILSNPDRPVSPGKWHLVILVNGEEICCLPFVVNGLMYVYSKGKLELR